ncbi:MAG: cobalt-precorrin-5B (C(1))-methyltransferase [Desulfobacterales bacterium]
MSFHSEKKLRTGFTTGAAAAAAVKAAMQYLLTGQFPPKVSIPLLTGDLMDIPIHACHAESARRAVCTVIKDAGDDPDITHNAEIGAKVEISDKAWQCRN